MVPRCGPAIGMQAVATGDRTVLAVGPGQTKQLRLGLVPDAHGDPEHAMRGHRTAGALRQAQDKLRPAATRTCLVRERIVLAILPAAGLELAVDAQLSVLQDLLDIQIAQRIGLLKQDLAVTLGPQHG